MATTERKHRRYGRFFALIKGKEHMFNREDLVWQFTDGRTSSMREMTDTEFEELCSCIDEKNRQEEHYLQEKIRRARSSVLLRIARIGINTIDNWDEVNAFLLSPKIAGKLLYEMNIDELNELIKKLEAIARKGGLKTMERQEDMPPIIPQQTITTTLTTNNKYKS